MTSVIRVSAPIAPICVTCANSGLATAAAQIGGSARAYLTGLSHRQSSTIMRIHGTITSGACIFMQTILYRERSHLPPIARQVGLGTGRSGRTPGMGPPQLRDGLDRFSFLLGGSGDGGRF